MNTKSKQIEITVGVCKKMPDIAVMMGTPFNCSKINLIKLKSNNPCELVNDAERSALAYALFETVRDKFIGSPLELSRTRVSRIDCDFIDGKFVITWNTQGSFSMLRKTVGLAFSTLDPAKLYSKYAENIKLLGGKNDRTVFNYIAAELCDSIKKTIKIAVSGKINIDDAKLKDLMASVEAKIPEMTAIPKEKTKPPTHDEYKCDYPHIKVSGLAAIVTADFIKSKSGGMGLEVFSDEIVVYNHSWESKKAALKDRVKDYVRQKYEKTGDDFGCILAYMAITQGYASCCTVTQMLKTKPKASDMVELIKKAIH